MWFYFTMSEGFLGCTWVHNRRLPKVKEGSKTGSKAVGQDKTALDSLKEEKKRSNASSVNDAYDKDSDKDYDKDYDNDEENPGQGEDSDEETSKAERPKRRGTPRQVISYRTGKWDKRDISRGMILTLSLCAVVVFMSLIGKIPVFFSGVMTLIGALTPFLIGGAIAFLLNPIVKAFNKPMYVLCKKIFKKDSKAESMANVISVIVTILIFVAFIVILLAIVLPQLKDSLVKLYDNIPTYINNIRAWLKNLLKGNPEVQATVLNYVDNLQDVLNKFLNDTLIPNMDTILLKVTSGIIDFLLVVVDIFIGIIISIYFLLGKENLKAKGKKLIYSSCSKERGNKILDGLEYVNRVFGGFISGKIIDSLVIGFMTGIFCAIVDMPYGVLVAVLIGVTNIIPFFGPFIGALPSALLILVEDPTMALIFLIFILVLQQLDANIVQPVVLGDSTGLSGLGVLLAIIVGSNLFGIVGMVLSVPVFAIIVAILQFLLKDRLKRKDLTPNTEYYVNLYGFDENGNPIRGEREKPKKEKRYHYMLGFLNKRVDKKKKMQMEEKHETNGVPDYRDIEDGYSVIEDPSDKKDKE